jgi:putative tricarboxylic transport membrane protein
MNATPGQAPVKSVMPKWVRGPQDFIGGIALMAIALFALWASSDLQGMRGFSFGAGTAPRMFGFLLLGLGAAVTVVGVLTEGAHLAKYHWRGPLFVSLSILAFALTIRPMGMIFVPSVGGVSHSPKELTLWEDCTRGADVLLGTVLELDQLS